MNDGIAIEVTGVRKRFRAPTGVELLALDEVSFAVRPNEFASIIGPSGCGKTTLLQILDGLLQPDGGEVLIDRKSVV